MGKVDAYMCVTFYVYIFFCQSEFNFVQINLFLLPPAGISGRPQE